METYFKFTQTSPDVKYCYSRGPVIDEREIHSYHEILYYLDGDATFICDGFTKKLSPHTLILIPKETYHLFKPDNAQKFERLKISFTSISRFDELIGQEFYSVRLFEKLEENLLATLKGICERLAEGEDNVKDRAFIHGAFLLLLSSLKTSADEPRESHRGRLIAEVLSYIENNISNDLTLSTLSHALGISPSTLSHTFKAELGISLHKYVTQKRIALADRYISIGNPPTKIFAECGFSDYSSFYKAYVKLMGQPPSRRND